MSQLIEALKNPAVYDHPVTDLRVLETHLSWVILTGTHAYKIKKPVAFSFVDYSTLEKRYHFCQEELRLNQPLASQIYLELITITGSEENPNINGEGEAIEYAIRMNEFSQNQLLNKLLKDNCVTTPMIDHLATTIAHFHNTRAITDNDTEYGSPEIVNLRVMDNFKTIKPLLNNTKQQEQIKLIEEWTRQQFITLESAIQKRKTLGMVRECHGDIHLGNIVLIDNEPVIFDCIDFNNQLRWVDIMADIGFIAMDLDSRGKANLANRLTNRYLEYTGDYIGLNVFRYYKAYRAMVRAKVSLLHLQETHIDEEEVARLKTRYQRCVNTVMHYIQPTQPFLAITHGVSSSGKSTVSRYVAENFNGIYLRSDVERKRLHGLGRDGRSPNKEIYTRHATAKTYERLYKLAKQIIKAGYPVVLDATFLKQEQREVAHQLAKVLNVPFAILHTHAPFEELSKWICKRAVTGDDPSEADTEVIRYQLETCEALSPTELAHTINIDMSKVVEDQDIFWLAPALKKLLQPVEQGELAISA